jgi:hypothetical protein
MNISKDNFDWEYYVLKNPDVKTAGNTTLDKCYRHWTTCGCHENRWVRSLNDGVERQVNTIRNHRPVALPKTVVKQREPIDIGFKIAIMIHIFDVNMMRFFVFYINYLNETYMNTNFDVYINIVEEDNPCGPELRKRVDECLKTINNPSVHCYYNQNRGGDIGGFVLLSKIVANSQTDYKYAIFVHSKNKSSWRKELCKCIFNIKFENLAKTPDVGIISSNKWIYKFDPPHQAVEFDRFKFHLIDLCSIYNLLYDQMWEFIAGTMFLAKIDIIKHIATHDIDKVYSMLNRVEAVDINWLTVMSEMKRDVKGTTNDYQYRLKYHKSLISDYMIEHTYERVIGLICKSLGLKLVGQ